MFLSPGGFVYADNLYGPSSSQPGGDWDWTTYTAPVWFEYINATFTGGTAYLGQYVDTGHTQLFWFNNFQAGSNIAFMSCTGTTHDSGISASGTHDYKFVWNGDADHDYYVDGSLIWNDTTDCTPSNSGDSFVAPNNATYDTIEICDADSCSPTPTPTPTPSGSASSTVISIDSAPNYYFFGFLIFAIFFYLGRSL